MTLHLTMVKETNMEIDGDLVLKFIDGIDRAMDEEGNGQRKAFNLLTELRKVGLRIVAVELPPEQPPASMMDLG